MMHSAICMALALLILAAAQVAGAAQYVVDARSPAASDANPGTADLPLKTIAAAALLAQAGDTVVVKAGVYREAARLANSGKPGAPITFAADPPGSVVITGADVVTGWERMPGQYPAYCVPWPHQFIIDHKDSKPVMHHPADAPLWGRAEQVIADGRHLVPMQGPQLLTAPWPGPQEGAALHFGIERDPRVPAPADPSTWHGAFAVDTDRDVLYLRLADGSDPKDHVIEASSRGLIFGVSPWDRPQGVEHVHVRGFVFRFGATFPQRAAVWLHGRYNLLEDCIVEDMAGSGVCVNGTMRRCVVRRCGHTGGAATGSGFLNEECLWEGNCWKPIDRGWDAGGVKIAWADGGIFRRCIFRRNGGPGLWMDIHVRNVLVTECVFQENELSGLFIEISRDVAVVRNLFAGNAAGAATGPAHVDWSCGGIQVAESKNCVLVQNTCVGNKDGITLREQGPRVLQTSDFGEVAYHNGGHVVVGNVCAFNKGYQLGLWYDNGFFGRHPADREQFPTEGAFEEHLKSTPEKVYDPTQQGMTIDRNVYFTAPGQQLPILYGVPWRARHRIFSDPAEFARATGFDAHSIIADPALAGLAVGDHRLTTGSPAWQLGAGWLAVPADLEAWMDGFLPPFR